MAQTKVTGREVSDKSIFDADIDLTTAVTHPVLVSSDRLLLVDPVDGNIKTSTYSNLLTALDVRYSLLAHTHPYEPVITAGTTSQYWRGDKTWRTLPATTQVLYMSGTNIVGSAGFQYKVASGDFCAGTSAQAVGGNTCAIGTSSVAYGDGAVAIGYGASCLGMHSIAIGTYTETNNDYSVLIGLEAAAYGDNAVAIGRNAIANNTGDITLGSTLFCNKTSIFGTISFPSLTTDGFLKIAGGEVYVDAGGSGTVSSVGLSLPNMFTVTGSPVTTSGTLTATLVSQTKNYVLVAPQFANGVPTFRKLTADDMPDLSAMYDNYYSWGVKLNAGSQFNILKSGATSYGSYYNGINFIAGTGITLTESSVFGGALGITINSTASFSGSQNTLLGRNATGYGVYSEMNPAAIRRIQTEDGSYDNLQYFGGAAAFTRRDLWVSTGALNVTYTGQSLADITGLTIGLGSYTTYEFEAILSVQTSAVTTGCQYAIAYTGSFSQYSGQIIGSINTSYARSYMLSSNTASGTFLTTSNQTGQILIKGIIKTTAGGTLSIKHLKVTSGTSTVLPYSYFKVTEI